MSDVKPIPEGYTAITPYLVVEGAAGYIDFLANAFNAVERMRIPMPGNLIGHAEVVIDGAAVMLSDAFPPDFPAPNGAAPPLRRGRRRRLRPRSERRRNQRRRARRQVLRRAHGKRDRPPAAFTGHSPPISRTWTWTP